MVLLIQPLAKNFIQLSLLSLLIIFGIRTSAQSPGGVSNGLKIWLKANAGITSSSGTVSNWANQSAIAPAGSASQAVVASRPNFQDNIFNGNPAIQTTTSKFMDIDYSSVLKNNGDATSGPMTMIIVSRRNTTNTVQQTLLGFPSSTVLNLEYRQPATDISVRWFAYDQTISAPSSGSIVAYNATNEQPSIVSARLGTGAPFIGKKLWWVHNGEAVSSPANSVTNISVQSGATGKLGRGYLNRTFVGQIAEVIMYSRCLTDAELIDVYTYLNVKYGISLPTSNHKFFTDSNFGFDIFGIGKNTASQGLNQASSVSAAPEDILQISDAASLDDNDYIFCGNDNGNVSFTAYGGTNCLIKSTLQRDWKIVKQGVPGKFSLSFDLNGLTGFNPNLLKLLVDLDNDGYDDEIPFDGVIASNVITFQELNLPSNATFTLAEYADTYYAVASGIASAAIWSYEPAGAPFVVPTFCAATHISVQNFSITSDIPAISCKNFSIGAGGVWNDANSLNVAGNVTIAGTYNGLTNNIITLNGVDAQTISGGGLMNVYNITYSNPSGVTIALNAGGVIAKNIVSVTTGTLTTNGKLTLSSSAISTGMIGPLTGGAAVSGNVTLNRRHNTSYVLGAASQSIYYISSPFQTSTLNDWIDDFQMTGFPGSTFPTASFKSPKFYNETTGGSSANGYITPTSINNQTVPGRGWQMKQTTSDANVGFFNIDVTGSIIQGDFSIPVTYTNNGVPSADGFNLIGNPYPCAIDWNAAGWTKNNIANAIYQWNGNTAQYATYINGVSNNGGSNIIPSSQAVFIVANGAAPVLSLNETCKTTSQGVFRSIADNEALRLTLESELYSDETVLIYNSNASPMFAFEEDAIKMRTISEEAPTLACIANMGEELSIYASNRNEHSTIIPLVVKPGIPGIHYFSHRGLSKYSKGACIVLEDLQTGVKYALNEHERIPVYLNETDEYNRFQLLITGTFASQTSTAGCFGEENGEIALNEPASAYLTDVMGNEIPCNNLKWTSLAAGHYFLQIIDNDICGATAAEVFIPQHEKIVARFDAKNVTCETDANGRLTSLVSGAIEPVSYAWSNGETTPFIENVTAGEYTLVITDAEGCTASDKASVGVQSDLKIDFNVPYLVPQRASTFTALTKEIASCSWNFGDGSGDVPGKTVTKTFQHPGDYFVTCRTQDTECIHEKTHTVKVASNSFQELVSANLTHQGLEFSFKFFEPTQLQIQAFNISGQLINSYTGSFESQTFYWESRSKLAGSVIEVTNTKTGESTTFHLGL